MVKIGIIGLPNAGKSTLFNALVTKGKAQTGKHPFTTIDKNVGVVPVPDSTLVDLAKTANISKITNTTISFVDIAGLVKGAHQGEGLGNQFLGHIREVDVILHVVRHFTDETIPHVHTQINPQEDIEIVNTELMLADVQSLKKQINHIDKKLKGKLDKNLKAKKALAEKALKDLNDGKMASELSLKSFHLLTSKPVVYVANVDEEKLSSPTPIKSEQDRSGIHIPALQCQTTAGGESRFRGNDTDSISLCVKFEEELAKLPWTEQRQFLKEYGLKHSALRLVIETCYKKLNLITFYTIAGNKEARAWSLKQGSTALDTAYTVHTDFAKKFIKAEVIGAPLLLSLGSWQKAHDKGKVQLVGKDYVVKNEDVIEIKTSA